MKWLSNRWIGGVEFVIFRDAGRCVVLEILGAEDSLRRFEGSYRDCEAFLDSLEIDFMENLF